MIQRVITAVGLLVLAASIAGATAADRAKGYAEWRRGDVLIVEGQRVRIHAGTRFEGDGITGIDSIPLGWEVEAEGERAADGTIVAAKVEAKPNGTAMFESDVLEATDEIERVWVRAGRMFEPGEDGAETTVGRIVEHGPDADRVRRITRRLVPPYVDFDRQVRVHVVATEEWNAAAMGNGAIWVYTGLIDSMSDDELAVVLGHELAHYTHEHSRRQAKSNMWRGLLGLGAAIASEAIKDDTARDIAAVAAGLGLTVWGSGYSRDLEDQADRVGLRYAHEAGYDIGAGTALWGKFRSRYGEADTVSNFFFGSHSRPSDRIRNIREEIALNYPDVSPASADVTAPPRPPQPEPEPAAGEGSEWVRQVRAQLDEVRRNAAEGYRPIADPLIAELADDESARHELEVQKGAEYFIIGVCDNDCDDVDLLIVDDRGTEVAADFEPDDYPVLRFEARRGGSWTVEVSMASCAAATCVYGIEVYVR